MPGRRLWFWISLSHILIKMMGDEGKVLGIGKHCDFQNSLLIVLILTIEHIEQLAELGIENLNK